MKSRRYILTTPQNFKKLSITKFVTHKQTIFGFQHFLCKKLKNLDISFRPQGGPCFYKQGQISIADRS